MKITKQILIVISLLIAIATHVSAQTMKEGDIMIEGYLGAGSLSNTSFKALAKLASNNNININVNTTTPYGGRFEYMLTDLIGVGLDANYGYTALTWSGYLDADTVAGVITVAGLYEFKLTKKVLRVMPTIKAHFGKSETMDYYAGLSFGYKQRTLKGVSNNPTDYQLKSVTTKAVYMPVAFRIASGIHYFPIENVGINAEIGFFGGALFTGGVSFKF